MIRAIAFDLDGTLLDTEADIAAAANRMRETLGLPPLPQARVRQFIGDGTPTLIARTLQDNPHAQPDSTSLQHAGQAAFHAHYLAGMLNTSVPYATVMSSLHALHAAGLPLACVTNKPIEYARPMLEQLGLAPYFCLTLGGNSLPHKKPHPLPLQHTAQVLGIGVESLLMVGDSENDVAAARAAACPVWVVDYGYTPDPHTLGADRVIAAFTEILTACGL